MLKWTFFGKKQKKPKAIDYNSQVSLTEDPEIEIRSKVKVFAAILRQYQFRIFFFLILFSTGTTIIAQSDTVSLTKISGPYLKSYWTDTKTIVVSPFHWKANQWSVFAGVAGAGIITYVYDEEISNFFLENQSNTADFISTYFIEPWGNGLYSLPLMAGIYLTGSKDSRHRSVALTGVKAFVLAGGASYVIKHLTHRHRPSETDPLNPNLWDGPFPMTFDYTSFPSGHSATAFAVASVLAFGYKDKPWIGITSYTLACLVGISRIYDGHHWGSDVLVGAALGSFIGITISKINLRRVLISPTAYRGGYGLQVTYSLP